MWLSEPKSINQRANLVKKKNIIKALQQTVLHPTEKTLKPALLFISLLHWLCMRHSVRGTQAACRLNQVYLSLFTGSWRCSKPHLGWCWAVCPLWLRWRTGCCAAPQWSPQAGWAPCSGSRQNPHAALRGRCSCRPERSCRSRWTAPSTGQGESLEV